MKKAFSLLMLLVAMLFAWPMRAQLQLTVADGTTTNAYVPIYGYYADALLRAQFIYPGTSLGAMAGNDINAMTFYAPSSTNTSWSGAVFQVKVGTTSATTLSDWSTATLTTVYSGSLSINSSGQMVVTFSTPFTYTDSTLNLLVEVVSVSEGEWSSCSWVGISSTGSSVQGYDYDDVSDIDADQQDFLPKCTFTYGPPATCPAPTHLAVDSMSVDWISISWTENGTATSWVVEYDTVPFTPGNSTAAFSGYAYDTTYLLDQLDTGHTYYIYVAADCGSEVSNYRPLVASTMEALPATVPYTCGFEGNGANGWELVNGSQTNYWTVGSGTNNGGSKALYITNNGTANQYTINSSSNVYAYRTIVLNTAGEYVYSFDWKSYGESGYDYARAALMPATFNPTAGNTTGWVQSSGTPVTGATVDLTQSNCLEVQSGWQTITGTFQLATPGVYKIVFFWHNDPSLGSNPPAAIDNVAILRNTCPAPYGLTASNVGTDEVTLTWHAGGTENSWYVTDGTNEDIAYDTTYTFLGLTSDHDYTFTVRAICDVDDTSRSVSTTVHTLQACARPLGFATTRVWGDTVAVIWRDTTLSGSYDLAIGPSGFNPDTAVYNVVAGVTDTTYEFSGLTVGGNYQFYVRTNCTNGYTSAWVGPIAATPGYILTMAANGTVTVPNACGYTIYDNGGASGSYTNNCNSTMTLYPNAGYILRLYGSCNVEAGWDFLRIYDGPSASSQVVFESTGTNTIDTITATNGPLTIVFTSDGSNTYSGFVLHAFCEVIPDCSPVNGVTVIPGVASAMVSWTPSINTLDTYSGATVEWKEATDSIWNTTSSTGTTATLSGLTANTLYDLRVAADCSGSTSRWEATQFTTHQYPCVEVDTALSIHDTIGITSTSDSYIPSYSLYNYSLTQQIYTAAEISGSGNITSLAVMPTTVNSQRNLEIYLAHTTQSTLSGFIHPTDMTLVYTGTTNLVENQWATFTFDIPFNYNGTDNLLVCFRDITGTWTSANQYAVHSGNSVYVYQDAASYDPFTETGGSTNSYRNTIILTGEACNQLSTCAPVPVVVGDVTPYTVDLSWAAGGSETGWNVYYKSENDSVFTYSGSTTSSNYTVMNLNPAISYQFRVVTLCGADSSTTVVSATTECAPVALPYTENFENQSGNYDRNCWTVGSTNLGTTYPLPYVVSLQGDPNKLCLFWNGAYAIMPQMDAPLNQLQVRFRFVQGGDNVRFLMGLMDDPTAPISTMRVLDTIIRSQIDSTTQYINYTYRFDQLASDDSAHIAFWDAFNDNYSFIDDLVVEYIPNCQNPTGVTASNATTTTVDLSWTDNTATSYLIEYGPRGFIQGTGTFVNAPASPYTLTGLTASTSYMAYVYSICGNDTSVASQEARFSTACGAVSTLPYTMNFEGYMDPGSTVTNVLPNCWMSESVGGNTQAHITYTTNTSMAPSQSYALRIMGNGIVALPEMGVPLDSLMITFHNYRSATSYGLIVGVVDDTATSGYLAATFTPIDTIAFGSTNVDSVAVFLTSYTGSNTRIALRAYGNTGTSASHYIDNVVINYAPSCPNVTRLRSTGTTTTTATLAWTENGGATQWELAVEASATATPTADSTVTANPLVVTGLTGGTDYYFWVRPICSVGDTGIWAGPLHVVPGQWIMRPNMTDTVRMCGGVIYDDGGPNGEYSNSQNSTVIIMPDHSGALVQVSGSSYTESSWDYLTIYDGIGTTGTQLWTDNGISSLTNFGPFTSTSGAITVVMHSDAIVAYSGFTINVTCMETHCHVTNLHLDPTVPASSSQLALAWDTCGAVSYEVEYGTPGFTLGTGTRMTTSVNSIVIPGLTSLTRYEVYVRAICGVGDTGSWVSGTFETTLCDNAQVTATGDESASSTTYYMPVNNYYRYTLSETIIDSAELGGPMDIQYISYYYNYSSPTTAKTNCTIYFKPTNKTTFSSSSDIELLDSSAVMVYTGPLNCSQGWNFFTLNAPYQYNGVGNLMVIVDDNSNDYNSSSCTFKANSSNGYKTLVWYSDSYNPTPTSSSFSGSMTYYDSRVVMQLIGCGSSGCARPVITSTSNTYQSATMTWVGSGTAYEVACKPVSSPTWPTETPVTGTSYTFTGLQPATAYQLRVRQDCDTMGYSNWSETIITTDSLPCLPPTGLMVSDITNATATLSWTAAGTESAWDVRVFNNTGFDSLYQNVTNPVTVGGFTAGVTYYAAVRALCGDAANIEGIWSDSIPFTAATCPNVTGLTTSNVTFSSVTLNWTAVPNAQGYRVAYRAGQDVDTVTVTTNTHTFGGLESEMTYVFYVQTICGTDWASEGWEQVTATTLEEPEDAATLTINVNDATMGYVTINGVETSYYAGLLGDEVSLAALPYEGYLFLNWSDGETSATRTYTLTSASSMLTATFRQSEGIGSVATPSCVLTPNPAKGATTVSVTGISGKVRISVLDLSGREIVTETLECAADCVKTLDIEGLAEGAYFVRVTSESNIPMVQKLIVR